ncbi:MAG: NAD-dependent epimerase/dehydratase family protein [Propionibacteriaceae bacterium]|jgi:nucleoside-diphosphate-sugar epimerase|nr:NAD-dependent epimerase/dehydratase family protein [Propionibacteriaceae bacterium]
MGAGGTGDRDDASGLDGVYASRSYRDDVDRIAGGDLGWDELRDSVCLLSGASGSVGSCLVDVLMARNRDHGLGATIHALARDPVRLHERFRRYAGDPRLVLTAGDVCTCAGTRTEGCQPDYVIHAASNTHPVAYDADPIGTIMTNVDGTNTLLALAAQAGARRALFLSSVEIYGQSRGDAARFSETDCGYINCHTLRAGYPESKRVGEALCEAYARLTGLGVVIPRLPRVFGPTLRPGDTKAASQFLWRAARGEDVVLKSAGDQWFSYCYVGDAVSAILTCLTSGVAGEAYNVAFPGGEIRLRDLAALAAAAGGTRVVGDVPTAAEQRGFSPATRAVMDGSKRAGLGWTPQWDLPEAVRRTVVSLREAGAQRGLVGSPRLG